MVELPKYDFQKHFRDVALRKKPVDVLDEIDTDSSMVMWQERSHTCNQAEIPQAIFRVGDRLASVIYLCDMEFWEVQLDGDDHQFDTFEEVLGFIEQSRREPIGLV